MKLGINSNQKMPYRLCLNIENIENKRPNYLVKHSESKKHLGIRIRGEADIRSVLRKKVFLEISQYSQENNGAGESFLINLQA